MIFDDDYDYFMKFLDRCKVKKVKKPNPDAHKYPRKVRCTSTFKVQKPKTQKGVKGVSYLPYMVKYQELNQDVVLQKVKENKNPKRIFMQGYPYTEAGLNSLRSNTVFRPKACNLNLKKYKPLRVSKEKELSWYKPGKEIIHVYKREVNNWRFYNDVYRLYYHKEPEVVYTRVYFSEEPSYIDYMSYDKSWEIYPFFTPANFAIAKQKVHDIFRRLHECRPIKEGYNNKEVNKRTFMNLSSAMALFLNSAQHYHVYLIMTHLGFDLENESKQWIWDTHQMEFDAMWLKINNVRSKKDFKLYEEFQKYLRARRAYRGYVNTWVRTREIFKENYWPDIEYAVKICFDWEVKHGFISKYDPKKLIDEFPEHIKEYERVYLRFSDPMIFCRHFKYLSVEEYWKRRGDPEEFEFDDLEKEIELVDTEPRLYDRVPPLYSDDDSYTKYLETHSSSYAIPNFNDNDQNDVSENVNKSKNKIDVCEEQNSDNDRETENMIQLYYQEEEKRIQHEELRKRYRREVKEKERQRREEVFSYDCKYDDDMGFEWDDVTTNYDPFTSEDYSDETIEWDDD